MLNHTSDYTFTFGNRVSRVHAGTHLPGLEDLRAAFTPSSAFLLVCDANTAPAARRIGEADMVILEPGEEAKTWASVEKILQGACRAGLGRDGLFIGVGGGVVCDLTAFAASVYMRGASLCLIPTTILAMADAALGGKTGFDLFGLKNLAGTFYPAGFVYIALESLAGLPDRERRSGMAEILKAAVLDEDGEFFARMESLGSKAGRIGLEDLAPLICRAVELKGRIVEEDPQETGERRALLNLGHTFGHALETAAGLGSLTHGEAVAWGIVRACGLGLALGITPSDRARSITELIRAYGYETRSLHPLIKDETLFRKALENDKKKKAGKLRFVVPAERGARLVFLDSSAEFPPLC